MGIHAKENKEPLSTDLLALIFFHFTFREKEFQPSKERRQTDTPDSKGRRPDYFLKVDLLGLECFLFVLEAKKHRHTSPVQTDLEKVGNQLKDSIDYLARNRVDISGVRVYGAVVVGKYRIFGFFFSTILYLISFCRAVSISYMPALSISLFSFFLLLCRR